MQIESREEAMRINRKFAIVAGAAIILSGVGSGIGVATGGGTPDDGESGDVALTGEDLRRASDAALAETGGGTVTATEAEPDENGYEVEVTLDGGRQVDIQLDQDFRVTASSDDVGDTDGPGDTDDGD
jgi:hypothetical protein